MLQGKGLGKTLLPNFFYNLSAITDEGRPRWVDEFADAAPSIIQLQDLSASFQKSKAQRNEAYSRWFASFFVIDDSGDCVPVIKPTQMKWQAIRVLHDKHSETLTRDWWPNYRDCLFRVFLNPQTIYDHATGEHKQWYLLCPEDGYLVNRQEMLKRGGNPPPREYTGRERWLSAHKELRRARLIPVECCHHLRNEGQEYRADL